jgi:hypothetical protein
VRALTGTAQRAQIARDEQSIIMNSSATDVLDQLSQLDGRERYEIQLRYEGALPDDDADDL